jgi:4-amino-4-deoxy-L-arabinose transferase-like glycosyltransferase
MLTYLLPALPVLVFWLLLVRFESRPLGDRVVKTAVVWTCLLLTLIEGLSAFRALTQANLALGWGIALVGLAAHQARTGYNWRRRTLSLHLPQPSWTLAAIFLMIALPTGIIAVLTLPNTWDALTYHVARVDHWAQDHSVAFYQTDNWRQNEPGPLAEYVVLNFRLLSGTYALANLTQWFAMLGSAVSVFSIAKTLGASNLGARLAVVFAATVPMAVLQASSTQTDYCVAFWLLAFVAQFMRWLHSRAASDVIFASTALGFAVLTKGTALAFAPPFGLWLLADFLVAFRAPLRSKAIILVLCGLAVLLPNLPHAARNIIAYGAPFGTNSATVVNHPMTIRAAATNVIRNVAMNFATPRLDINQALVSGLQTSAGAIGLDLSDRNTTFRGLEFAIWSNIRNEDLAGNALHTTIIFAVFVTLLWSTSRLGRFDGAYAVCAAAGFLIFAAILKWQPWASRLMLPGFLLSAPLVGKIIADRFSTRVTGFLLSMILLCGALPFVILNGSKPLIPFHGQAPIWELPRHATMFVNQPELEAQYAAIANYLKQCGCDQLGLVADEGAWETPIFSAMAERGPTPFRIEQLPPSPARGDLTYPLGPFMPDAILWTGSKNPEQVAFAGRVFLSAFDTEKLHVFRPPEHADKN